MDDIQLVIDLVDLAAIAWAIGGAVVGVLGTLMFGRRYKQRIAALEARESMPAIHQTFNFHAGEDSSEDLRHLRDALNVETVRELRETIDDLPQKPLGTDGTTYVDLPNGTRVVTLPSGEIRLALPVQISGTVVSGFTSASAATVTRKPEDQS